MGRYYFQTPSPDLEAIAKRLVVWFKQHEYEVDSTKDDQCYFVQAKKTGSLRTLTGTNIAFKITLSPSDVPDEFLCDMATGKWTANIAGAGMTALFTGGATLLTGAMGAAWTYKVERDIVEFMETTLRFKKSRTEGQSPAAEEPMAVHASPPPPPGPKASPQAMSVKQQAKARVVGEIARLEEACKAGILTSAELESKKAEAVSKEYEYEVALLVEERSTKLSHALTAGILSQAEYDAKLSHVKEAVENEVKGERQKALHADQMAKLTAAREAGILNDEEYKAKVLALG